MATPHGDRFLGNARRRGDTAPADRYVNLPHASNRFRWRPVFEQVLPWRSLSSAAEIDPLRTRGQKRCCSATIEIILASTATVGDRYSRVDHRIAIDEQRAQVPLASEVNTSPLLRRQGSALANGRIPVCLRERPRGGRDRSCESDRSPAR
jgi:hypothetical protein